MRSTKQSRSASPKRKPANSRNSKMKRFVFNEKSKKTSERGRLPRKTKRDAADLTRRSTTVSGSSKKQRKRLS